MRAIFTALTPILGVTVFFCSLLSAPLYTVAYAADAKDSSSQASVSEAILLADIAYREGSYAQAARYYLEAARATDDVELAENATRSAARSDSVELLKQAGRFWSVLEPDNIASAEFLARVYSDVGEIDEAVAQLDRIRRSYEGGADLGFDSITPYLQRERNRRKAVILMQHLVIGHEQIPAAVYGLAYMQARAHLFDDALVSVNKAIALNKDSSRSIRFKADVLHALERDDEALSALKSAVDRLGQRELRVHYARLLQLNKLSDQAIEQYKIIVFDNNSRDDEDYIALGSLLYDAQRYDEAVAVYTKLTQVNPEMPHSWFYLGEIAEILSDDKAAIDWYSQVPESQFYVDAGKKRAALLAKRGDLAAARILIAELRALNYFGVGSELALLEGDLLQQANQPELAKNIYKVALEASPHDQDLLLARAVLAKNQGDEHYFESELEKIIESDPEHVDSLYVMGLFLAEQARYHEARKHFEVLSKLRPKDTTVAAHYGEVLWHEGDKAAAQQVWAQGLLINPKSKLIYTMTDRYSAQ